MPPSSCLKKIFSRIKLFYFKLLQILGQIMHVASSVRRCKRQFQYQTLNAGEISSVDKSGTRLQMVNRVAVPGGPSRAELSYQTHSSFGVIFIPSRRGGNEQRANMKRYRAAVSWRASLALTQ